MKSNTFPPQRDPDLSGPEELLAKVMFRLAGQIRPAQRDVTGRNFISLNYYYSRPPPHSSLQEGQ